jgi:hypothetical protein
MGSQRAPVRFAHLPVSAGKLFSQAETQVQRLADLPAAG